ncbi:MAG: hypothetical protein HOP19_09325, partial [Acidobacteria bacterium]|nr:hypothetical protein [Acidobacteriota bacterium]
MSAALSGVFLLAAVWMLAPFTTSHAQSGSEPKSQKLMDLSPEKQAEEKWLQHAAQQSLIAAQDEVVFQDINDIAVYQLNNVLRRPPSNF